MSAIEITSDKIKLIWIASRGSNSSNKNGVAIIEKPKPVLVCRIEATRIIIENKTIVSKKTPSINHLLASSLTDENI